MMRNVTSAPHLTPPLVFLDTSFDVTAGEMTLIFCYVFWFMQKLGSIMSQMRECKTEQGLNACITKKIIIKS